MPSKPLIFAYDEMVLILIALIGVANPSALSQEGDGFSFDFQWLDCKEDLDEEERLISKCRAVLDAASNGQSSRPACELALDSAEGRRIALAINRLQRLQPWPMDVAELCRNIGARLSSIS